MLKRRPGMTIFETLLSLALLTVVILGGFDFFSRARRMFFRLSEAQDAAERAQSALDKIRLDILDAGRGLSDPIRMEVLQAIEQTEVGMVFQSADLAVSLAIDAPAGASVIRVTDGEGFSAGQDVCLVGRSNAEIGAVRSADGPAITLTSAVRDGFSAADTTVILIHRVVFLWPAVDGILRRKVNAASAQPLLEDVAAFRCEYDASANLARIGIRLAAKPENEYAVTIFPKNAALARAARRP
jgi:type II secretory pathway pseudopilin PulG